MNTKRLTMWTVALAMLIAPAFALAQVRDDGGFFSPKAVAKANEEIALLKKERGKQLVIETYSTIPAAQRADLDAKGRQKFFADWSGQRFAEQRLNGVLVLLTKDPRYIHVKGGTETDIEAFNSADANRLRETMTAGFNAKDFDRGLLDGVAHVRQTMDARATGGPVGATSSTQQPGATAAPVPTPDISKQNEGGISMVTIVILVVGAFILFSLFRRLFAGRQQYQQPRYGANQNQPGDPQQQGYGQPGYGQQGGGGFGRGLGGGLLGGLGGMFLYDQLFRRDNAAHGSDATQQGGAGTQDPSNTGGQFSGDDQGQTFSDSGGSWGDSDGGDSGGGDSGGDF